MFFRNTFGLTGINADLEKTAIRLDFHSHSAIPRWQCHDDRRRQNVRTAAAIAGMIAATASDRFWVLDFVHVFSSLLWTGIDLFMGFVLGPILRRADVTVRRAIAARMTARTLVLMPTLAVI